jgi:tRNA(Ile)-lysidine synthase
MLYPDVKKFIEENRFLEDGDGVVVGVSGGMDSVVLLHILQRLSRGIGIRLIAGHVNYGLRGRESKGDEKFVKDLCASFGIPCEVLTACLKKGENIQDEARRVRLEFLQGVAAKYGAREIALAHHLGDQIETVLLHMIRGAGLGGMGGISPLSYLGEHRIIRPLLCASKADIARYAKACGIRHREDSSNATKKYSRNRIRHTIVPAMMKMNPRLADAISQMTDTLRADDDALEAMSNAALDDVAIRSAGDGFVVSRVSFLEFPKAIRRRMIRMIYERISGSTKDLCTDHVEKVDHISASKRGRGSYRLPKSIKFERTGDILSFKR